MALSRKHYEEVAQILNDVAGFYANIQKPDAVTGVEHVAADLADYFAKDNSGFDRDRFLAAVSK